MLFPSLSRLTLATLCVAMAAAPARAADLDYRTPPSERYGTAYADPRYADIYGQRAPEVPPHGYAQPRYAPPSYGHPGYAHPGYAPAPVPIPEAPIYRYGHRDEVMPPPGYAPQARYAEPPQRFSGRAPGCLSKDVIQRELVADGWRDFHAPDVLNANEAHIRARRPDGRLFQLRVDRCSGEIIAAYPLQERGPTYGGYGIPRAY